MNMTSTFTRNRLGTLFVGLMCLNLCACSSMSVAAFKIQAQRFAAEQAQKTAQTAELQSAFGQPASAEQTEAPAAGAAHITAAPELNSASDQPGNENSSDSVAGPFTTATTTKKPDTPESVELPKSKAILPSPVIQQTAAQFTGDDEDLNLEPYTIIPRRNRGVHAVNVSQRLTPEQDAKPVTAIEEPQPTAPVPAADVVTTAPAGSTTPTETAPADGITGETPVDPDAPVFDGPDAGPAVVIKQKTKTEPAQQPVAQPVPTPPQSPVDKDAPNITNVITAPAKLPVNVATKTAPDGLPVFELKNGTLIPQVLKESSQLVPAPMAPKSLKPGIARIFKKAPPVSKFTPATERIEIGKVAVGMPPAPEVVIPPGAVLDYPDEYLFDGGDRDLPVHYGDGLRHGLNTEDTVAEYTDHTGDKHTKATNRVAIYAPYFAAVRSFSGLQERNNVTRLAANRKTVVGAGLKSKDRLDSATEHKPLQGVRMRSRASGFDGDAVVKEFSRSRRHADHVKLLNAFQEFSVLKRGQYDRTNQARLAITQQAARAWSRDLYPQITGSRSAAVEVYDNIKAQVHIGIDDGKKTKGNLQIVKAADRQIAEPGDEITFAIRYNNIGDHDLHNITIVDNLTPRLKFIPDSEDSDRPGVLATTDNGEGSVVVRFKLNDPLPGHTGGILTFKVRVE